MSLTSHLDTHLLADQRMAFQRILSRTGSLVAAATEALDEGLDPALIMEEMTRDRSCPTLVASRGRIAEEIKGDAQVAGMMSLALQNVALASHAEAPFQAIISRDDVLASEAAFDEEIAGYLGSDEDQARAARADLALVQILREDLRHQALILMEADVLRQLRSAAPGVPTADQVRQFVHIVADRLQTSSLLLLSTRQPLRTLLDEHLTAERTRLDAERLDTQPSPAVERPRRAQPARSL